MQWSVATCCRTVVRNRPLIYILAPPFCLLNITSFQSLGSCIEITAGIFQLFVQWSCFTFMYDSSFKALFRLCSCSCVPLSASFILYMKFYPEHLKYVEVDIEAPDTPLIQVKTPIKSSEWRASVVCAWITLGHLYVCPLPSKRERGGDNNPFLNSWLTTVINFQPIQCDSNDLLDDYRSTFTRPTRLSSAEDPKLGYVPRRHIRITRRDSICASDNPYLPTQGRRSVEYTDDVYSISRFCRNDCQHRASVSIVRSCSLIFTHDFPLNLIDLGRTGRAG